jgi:nitrogen-specific signal transduction histidine kinase/ActR/RegA family two-component response regulator
MKPDVFFVLESAGWPALLIESTGVIRRANDAALELFGPSIRSEGTKLEAIWARENDTRPEVFLPKWDRSSQPTVPLKFSVKGTPKPFSCVICAGHKDGERYYVFQLLPETAAHPAPVPAAPAAAPAKPDATSVDAGLALKQKLDCALQLTKTVALDFNNALTTVLGHTSLLLSKIEPNHAWRYALVEIEKAAERAAEIAHDLAAFSWNDKEVKSQNAANLNELLLRTVEFFQTPAYANIFWSLQWEDNLFSAKVDEAKLQQAFMKILENAVQAVGPNGRIVVRTSNVEVVEQLVDGNVRLGPGVYVCCEIGDTGCGIAPEHLPRVFEPFFTTKPNPPHRGIGLAFVYGIVTNHRGGVAISSRPGEGTSVRVYLPALKKTVRPKNSIKDDELSGNKTILMVDDEELLLTMGQTVLSSYGYYVMTANSGKKALEIMNEQASQIDLLITDLVMPNMSGRELIDHVRRLSPDIKILCTTGYVQPTGATRQGSYLQKPFTSHDLLRKVKEILGVEEPAPKA